MTTLLRIPGGVEQTSIDCACSQDAYELRIRRSAENLRALGAPETLIAHHEGILAGITGENARLHGEREEGIEMDRPYVPTDDGLGVFRGLRSALFLTIGIVIGVGLMFAIFGTLHDSTGRVRAAVERAE